MRDKDRESESGREISNGKNKEFEKEKNLLYVSDRE